MLENVLMRTTLGDRITDFKCRKFQKSSIYCYVTAARLDRYSVSGGVDGSADRLTPLTVIKYGKHYFFIYLLYLQEHGRCVERSFSNHFLLNQQKKSKIAVL